MEFQTTIDAIDFPRLVSDYYSVNSSDVEVMRVFDILGNAQYEICEGEQIELFASASSRATESTNPMIALLQIDSLNGIKARSTGDQTPNRNFFIFNKELEAQNFVIPQRLQALDAEFTTIIDSSNPII